MAARTICSAPSHGQASVQDTQPLILMSNKSSMTSSVCFLEWQFPGILSHAPRAVAKPAERSERTRLAWCVCKASRDVSECPTQIDSSGSVFAPLRRSFSRLPSIFISCGVAQLCTGSCSDGGARLVCKTAFARLVG